MWSNPTAPDLRKLHEQAFELRRLVEYISRQENEIVAAANSPGLAPTHSLGNIPVPAYRWGQAHAAALVQAAWEVSVRYRLGDAFTALLQSYDLKPGDRRVVERAAMQFTKTRRARVSSGKAVSAYVKVVKDYRQYSEAFDRTLFEGKLHEGGPTAGTFTLINAGGFSSKVMEGVVQRVAEAAQRLGAKGLDRILYGDIHVTNTIRRSARVLAFYVVEDDALFVRANIPRLSQDAAVEAITHELAHRLHFKFLRAEKNPGVKFPAALWAPTSSADRALFNIYEKLRLKEAELLRTAVPERGEKIESRGRVFEVVGWRPGRKGTVVQLRGPGGVPASVPLESYLHFKGKTPGVFVSDYARTAYQENFAEMVSAYCADKLPADQVAMLRGVIG